MISPQSIVVLKQYISRAKKTAEKASVIVITYNRWEWTEMTLNSIFENTFFPYDLIVVDNHSTDGTVERLKQLRRSEKIHTLILLPKNYGVYVGFNVGLKYGNYNGCLSILGNDILVSPYWLSACCFFASRLKGLVAPPTQAKVRGWVTKHKRPIRKYEGMRIVRITWGVVPPVMTKATLQKIGYFREDIGKGELSFYGIADTEYGERATKLGVGTYYILDTDCKHIPGMLGEQQGKTFREIEGEKYPKYRKWKVDIMKVKRPRWFKGIYPRHKRYETWCTKAWIEQFVFKP